MRTLFARAGAIAAGGLLSLGLAAPAMANSNISINPGNLMPPPTAQSFGSHECSANMGGGPFAGQDVWVFVLPNHDQSGDFVSLHLTFSTPNGTVTRDIPADANSAILLNGNSFAWIRTPAGWTLTAATAVITGTAAFFNLTHTCPASGSPSPSTSPSSSPSASESPSESPSASPSESPSESPSASGTPMPSPSESTVPPSETSGPTPSGGPNTGGGGSLSTGGFLLGTGALLASGTAGIGLVLLARRRRGLV